MSLEKKRTQLKDNISCRTTTKLLLILVDGKEIAWTSFRKYWKIKSKMIWWSSPNTKIYQFTLSTKTFSPAYASNGVNPYYINMAVTIDIDATDDDVQRLSSDSFSSCAASSKCPLTTWLSELLRLAHLMKIRVMKSTMIKKLVIYGCLDYFF